MSRRIRVISYSRLVTRENLYDWRYIEKCKVQVASYHNLNAESSEKVRVSLRQPATNPYSSPLPQRSKILLSKEICLHLKTSPLFKK
jgi:hypothetical protein